MSNWFRTKRDELELTQRKMGDLCGVTGETIHRWENFRNAPDPSQIEQLCIAYEESFDELARQIARLAVEVRHRNKMRRAA